MTHDAASMLSALKDVGGVIGSFFISSQGDVLARDMPSLFDDDTMDEVAPRVLRMGEALPEDASRVEQCLIRYTDHVLYLRRSEHGTFCVLAARAVNLAALKMGVNLTLRRVGPLLQAPPENRVNTTPTPSVQSVQTAAREVALEATMNSAPSAVPTSRPAMRRFRGSFVPNKS